MTWPLSDFRSQGKRGASVHVPSRDTHNTCALLFLLAPPPCPHALLPCTTTAQLSLPHPSRPPLTIAPPGRELASEAADGFTVTVSAAAAALHFTFPLLTTLCISVTQKRRAHVPFKKCTKYEGVACRRLG